MLASQSVFSYFCEYGIFRNVLLINRVFVWSLFYNMSWETFVFRYVITLAVLKTLDMEANQTGARKPVSSQFVLACCSRGKFTSSAEQNALSYVNCIIWDLSVCL